MSEHIETSTAEGAARAIAAVMEPLVDWAIAQGLTYQQLDEVLRIAMVKAAVKTGAETASAVHVRTGMHRKEIVRLLQAPTNTPAAPATLTAQIWERWIAAAPFADAKHRAKALPRLRRDGGELSFEALVETVNRNVRPRSVLDHLIANGAVRLDDKDRVVPTNPLSNAAFTRLNQADAVARHIGDHARVLINNLLSVGERDFESTVYARKLSESSVRELCRWAVPRINKLLVQIDERVGDAELQDHALPDAVTQRFTVGAFCRAGGMSAGLISPTTV